MPSGINRVMPGRTLTASVGEENLVGGSEEEQEQASRNRTIRELRDRKTFLERELAAVTTALTLLDENREALGIYHTIRRAM